MSLKILPIKREIRSLQKPIIETVSIDFIRRRKMMDEVCVRGRRCWERIQFIATAAMHHEIRFNLQTHFDFNLRWCTTHILGCWSKGCFISSLRNGCFRHIRTTYKCHSARWKLENQQNYFEIGIRVKTDGERNRSRVDRQQTDV